MDKKNEDTGNMLDASKVNEKYAKNEYRLPVCVACSPGCIYERGSLVVQLERLSVQRSL